MENLNDEIRRRTEIIREAVEALNQALQKPLPPKSIDPTARLELLLTRPDHQADPVARVQSLIDQGRDEHDRAIKAKMLEDSIAETQEELHALETKLKEERQSLSKSFSQMQKLALDLQKAQITALKAAIALKKHGNQLNKQAQMVDGLDRFRDMSDRNSRIFWPIVLEGKILLRHPTLREIEELRDMLNDLI